MLYLSYRGGLMDNLTQERLEDVKIFVDSCNEFINGKFILADMKIAKILKAIAASEDIYNLLAECMINFDFEYELKKCCVKNSTENGSFALPTETYKLIPVVFCLLVQIDSKRIDFDYFLKTQFPYAKGQNEEYERFSMQVVAPFRNAIAGLFDVSTEVRKEETPKQEPSIIDLKIQEQLEGGRQEPQEEDEVEEELESQEEYIEPAYIEKPLSKNSLEVLFEEVKKQAEYMQQLTPYIKKREKRENIVILLKGLIKVCELEDMLLLSSLMIAVNEIGGNEKVLKENLRNISSAYARFFAQND